MPENPCQAAWARRKLLGLYMGLACGMLQALATCIPVAGFLRHFPGRAGGRTPPFLKPRFLQFTRLSQTLRLQVVPVIIHQASNMWIHTTDKCGAGNRPAGNPAAAEVAQAQCCEGPSQQHCTALQVCKGEVAPSQLAGVPGDGLIYSALYGPALNRQPVSLQRGDCDQCMRR